MEAMAVPTYTSGLRDARRWTRTLHFWSRTVPSPSLARDWLFHVMGCGLWLVAMLSVGLLNACTRPPRADPPNDTRITARAAWKLVEPYALERNPKARIALARPLYREQADHLSDLALDGRFSSWLFLTCSADHSDCVRASLDAAVSPPSISLEATDLGSDLGSFSLDSWVVDSDMALVIAQQSGLSNWYAERSSAHPKDALLFSMELLASEDSDAVWRIVGQVNLEGLEVRLSASDGALLSWIELVDCDICGF